MKPVEELDEHSIAYASLSQKRHYQSTLGSIELCEDFLREHPWYRKKIPSSNFLL
jgi:hypothetical protein